MLRPAQTHKFRLQYIPIKYTQTTPRFTRDIVFNGQRYRVGLPVNSTLRLEGVPVRLRVRLHLANRGFGGFILDVEVHRRRRRRCRRPLVDRVHPREGADSRHRRHRPRLRRAEHLDHGRGHRRSSCRTACSKDTNGHYLDLNIYGTLNFTNNVGVQVGYRSFDVGYVVDDRHRIVRR